ncbi:hypothetical protein HK099_007709 [Clydaea vesicula]|uniref:Homoserine dehydrogenase n=1 Tax=Clydaea vesicula TaxID=447962 RepID=A0AAD5TYB8_9FUNG|nr:hypothetical protein HK099_007709 [Clydaea vesicula]KAJ3378900.1 hypothetical protein HDU92_007051 [Lobulomyces angularis]
MLSIVLVGPGLVGNELLTQLTKNGKQHGIRVIAISNSKRMVLGTDLSDNFTLDSERDLYRIEEHAEKFKPCAFVDCTSNQDIANLYVQWLKKGFSVVTPNKKAFSSDLSLYSKILELTDRTLNPTAPFVRHEATVGAGLPIISTLTNLVKTGDKILKIEGIFSGTLSFIFNTFSDSNLKFSEIVKDAKSKGFTEPDPRDDLNGVDVARKTTILARLSGLKNTTLESFPTENIVPKELRNLNTVEFMERLPEFDEHFENLKLEAKKENKILRYVGVVDVSNQKCSVELKSFDKSHPFGGLKGSDNIIAFYTERFSPQPLIIQGAGAGKEVTAFGIYCDILSIL